MRFALQFHVRRVVLEQFAWRRRCALGSLQSHITGGTGKFARVTGYLDYLGMADLTQNTLVLRYRGQVCYSHERVMPLRASRKYLRNLVRSLLTYASAAATG